jgi:hypothetical protein
LNNRVVLAGLLVSAIFACALASARAGETTVGLTLNATIGTHTEADGSVALPVVPVPIFSIDHREGRFAVHLEGVPPIGPVGLSNGDATKLSLLDGAIRYAIAPHAWAGIGETIFNQRTEYPGDDAQSSRVVGGRYEIGATLWRSGGQRIEASIAASPSMHGAITDVFSFGPGLSVTSTGSERASLVDSQAAWSTTRGRSIFTAGLRWINYSARFPDGSTADQNRILTPFVGWSTRL